MRSGCDVLRCISPIGHKNELEVMINERENRKTVVLNVEHVSRLSQNYLLLKVVRRQVLWRNTGKIHQTLVKFLIHL
jgi:hypothetical protein